MKLEVKKEEFRLKLKGKTAVFVDWANVYCWKDFLKWGIGPGSFLKMSPRRRRGAQLNFLYHKRKILSR